MVKHKTTNSFIIEQFKKIAWALACLSLILGYFFIVKPEHEKLSEKAANDIARVKQEQEVKETTLNRLQRRLGEFTALQEHNSEVLERMLPPLSRKEEAIVSLNAVAASLNLYLTSVEVENPTTPEEYFGSKLDVPLAISIVPVSVTIKGQAITYEKIKTLLSAFHERYGIFNIKDLELGESAGGAGRGDELTVSIDVFFTDDTAPLAS